MNLLTNLFLHWLILELTGLGHNQYEGRKCIFMSLNVFIIYHSVFWKVSVCALIGRVNERPIWITGKKANLWGWICYRHTQKIQIANNYRNHVFLGKWEGSANKGSAIKPADPEPAWWERSSFQKWSSGLHSCSLARLLSHRHTHYAPSDSMTEYKDHTNEDSS